MKSKVGMVFSRRSYDQQEIEVCMNSVLKNVFISMFFLVGIAQASEMKLQGYYIVYQTPEGSLQFGTVDRFFKPREELGGSFGSYRWAIESLQIKNCPDLDVLAEAPLKTKGGQIISVKPVTCQFSVPEHNFESIPEIGYLIKGSQLGQLADGSKVQFWIFNLAWRKHFTYATPDSTNPSAPKSVSLYMN